MHSRREQAHHAHPMISCNPAQEYPRIHKSAYIDPTAVIIGNVCIGRNVFVGPLAAIRADEPQSRIIIRDGCNIQDRVVIHALAGTAVSVDKTSSLSHGCIVHGPCAIGTRCFIGFGAVVFQTRLADGVVVKHLAIVEGVRIGKGKMVACGQVITNAKQAGALAPADSRTKKFTQAVVKANWNLVKGYRHA